MPVQPIIDQLTKIKTLHQSLLSVSQAKTESLKTGETAQLQKLLISERQHVQAIGQAEAGRQTLVREWRSETGQPAGDSTLSAILERLEGPAEKEALEQVMLALSGVLAALKQQEQLNQELTKQSLKFVEMSIDMFDPELQHAGYSQQAGRRDNRSPKRSLFDSKA